MFFFTIYKDTTKNGENELHAAKNASFKIFASSYQKRDWWWALANPSFGMTPIT